MKGRTVVIWVLLLLLIDQAIKVYIKTNFYYGEEIKVLVLDWFRLHFLENSGMAWGLNFGNGDLAKLFLTLFRLGAVIWGFFYIKKIIHKKYSQGYILSVALIFAGALDNLFDNFFYGLIFERSDPVTENLADAFPTGGGYAGLMYGRVVDMWYFPIIDTKLLDWIPIWGGNDFEFFQPVFNTADVWITIGVMGLIIFQNRVRKKEQ
ncbi:lipoprotein signal peptidase [Antarcticibacterium arcticum]|uniref:Lipoprotein signal peptidase n=1 Tax=Antarcticibacterium arcticum TaxID=2585771 RepID=A0A5B8YLP1_9FLAO|nr:lipoprotein signal peptidase [Antarcticibacterium arcticum]QED37186.1 lipoprotein signal peptidase [Antarcticibacterium arcticum]